MIKELIKLKAALKNTNAEYSINRIIKISQSESDQIDLANYEVVYSKLAEIMPAISADEILLVLGSNIEKSEDLKALGSQYLDIEDGDTFEEAFSKASGGSENDSDVLRNIASVVLRHTKDV